MRDEMRENCRSLTGIYTPEETVPPSRALPNQGFLYLVPVCNLRVSFYPPISPQVGKGTDRPVFPPFPRVNSVLSSIEREREGGWGRARVRREELGRQRPL